ncbi:hypothetical protein BDR26DRAFT_942372 [Obelidium mucronatum]|nr:hypothetical protein BDR26DRAFT_942372 [Obelidium mucronatum]
MTPRKKSKMAGPTKDELRAQLDAALKHVASLTVATINAVVTVKAAAATAVAAAVVIPNISGLWDMFIFPSQVVDKQPAISKKKIKARPSSKLK